MDDDEWVPDEPVIEHWSLEVHVEDNDVIAVFYDVAGVPLIEVRERPSVPFGFQVP